MAADEGFLRRWARRKQAVRSAEAAEIHSPAPSPAVPGAEPAAAFGRSAPGLAHETAPEPDPDLELPPLESLTASSDFTAFLQKGVSAAVQSRALRVAWESDAAIAGFRGMAEYAWDFNAPGYGKLWATDDVAKLVTQVLRGAVPVEPEPPPVPEAVPGVDAPGQNPAEEPASAVAGAPVDVDVDVAVADASAAAGDAVTPPDAGPPAPAVEAEDVVPRAAVVRRHGSALPG